MTRCVMLDSTAAVDNISVSRRGTWSSHHVEPGRRRWPLRDLEVTTKRRPVNAWQRGVDSRTAGDGSEQSQCSSSPIQTLLVATSDEFRGPCAYRDPSENSEKPFSLTENLTNLCSEVTFNAKRALHSHLRLNDYGAL